MNERPSLFAFRPTFVIPDAHGNHSLVRGLLEQEGIIEQDWGLDGSLSVAARVMSPHEVQVVQLGDLANCVADSEADDCAALDLVCDGLIDVMLIGNHEHPYFGGPAFSGYWSHGEVRRRLIQIERRGGLQAALAVGPVLVSHAGFTSYWLREFGGWDWSAEKIADCANRTWERDKRALAFSAIGARRGGWEREGGLLWADWDEPKPRHLSQLVGHTVGSDVRRRSGATCIDLGAGKRSTRIAGAWIRDGEVEIVTHGTSAHEVAA